MLKVKIICVQGLKVLIDFLKFKFSISLPSLVRIFLNSSISFALNALACGCYLIINDKYPKDYLIKLKVVKIYKGKAH